MINKAVKKLSPFTHLTLEQKELIKQILNFSSKHLNSSTPAVFTIYGDAGTGKSVILSNLFYQIQKASREKKGALANTKNYFLVNHPEILKVYKEIAGEIKQLYKKDYMRPTSFINQADKTGKTADIVVIDEAHLLLSKPDHYNNFYYQNQLEEIIKRAKVVILVFDQYQVLRMKSLWTTSRLQKITHQYPHQDYYLKHQFRMSAPDDLLDWFNNFTAGYLASLPKDATKNYDFRIYSDAEKMRKDIVKRNEEVGLSRILSTSGYPSTLDGGKHFITEGNFKMPWDQYNYTATPWAEIPKTIDEVGSIYTCQGFDLNYAGIIIGPPFYQEKGTRHIKVDLTKITDIEMFKKRTDLNDPKEIDHLEKQMVMNSLNVLFKRGVKGCYLYAHDPFLRNSLVHIYQSLNN